MFSFHNIGKPVTTFLTSINDILLSLQVGVLEELEIPKFKSMRHFLSNYF